jgi:hypothetical protein
MVPPSYGLPRPPQAQYSMAHRNNRFKNAMDSVHLTLTVHHLCVIVRLRHSGPGHGTLCLWWRWLQVHPPVAIQPTDFMQAATRSSCWWHANISSICC